jgi:acetylornithine/succinyldiaminopimelate/putrescine aminotransferase
VVFFTNSGTEANELALMIARLYTGCQDIISLRNGYHGNAAGTMGATAQSLWKFNVIQVNLLEKLWAFLWLNVVCFFEKSKMMTPSFMESIQCEVRRRLWTSGNLRKLSRGCVFGNFWLRKIKDFVFFFFF